jgi:hypothetical protein
LVAERVLLASAIVEVVEHFPLVEVIKRPWPKSSCSKRIFSATSSGLPTTSAPRGMRPASNCPRVMADQPRSRPIRFIMAA